jgi:ATP-binding cassette subfamily F protein uup
LSFAERKRLDDLPAVIARLEAEIAKLSDLLSDPGLFAREPAKFAAAGRMLAERQAALAAAEEDWLALAERAEG